MDIRSFACYLSISLSLYISISLSLYLTIVLGMVINNYYVRVTHV
jgi:hypothetical protein